jgi:hypothetical protein
VALWKYMLIAFYSLMTAPVIAAQLVPDEPSVLLRSLQRSGQAHGLDEYETDDAMRGAATWYFAFSCKGDTGTLMSSPAGAHLALVSDTPFGSAMREMLAEFVILDQGNPRPATCATAHEIASGTLR